MKSWFIALIVVAVFLSFSGFSNSFIMNSEITKLQEKLLVIDRLNTEVLTSVALARNDYFDFINSAVRNTDKGVHLLREAAEKIDKAAGLALGKEIKEKGMLVLKLINENIVLSESTVKEKINETKNMKVLAQKLALEKEIFAEISELTQITQKDMETRINNIKSVSSKFILYSFFLLIFVGGGIIITLVMYNVTTKVQNEELSYLNSGNLIDRNTGFSNKLYFTLRLKELLNKASRFKEEVAVVFINIEPDKKTPEIARASFKSAGQLVEKWTRTYDIMALYEDKLALLFDKTGQKEAGVTVNRIKNHLEKLELTFDRQERKMFFWDKIVAEKVKFMVSFDIYIYPEDKEKIELLIKS